ncbi:MAG: M1 family metallopeptidase [Bacteroidia bacterium]|nr:M1 family metallopeptidase [Bacteroidia bacterium]
MARTIRLLVLVGLVSAQQDPATLALLYKYDVKFWWLNLEVSHTSRQLGPSWVLSRLEVKAPFLDTLAFELHNSLIVDSVKVNGEALSFIRRGHTVRIPLNPSLPQGALIEAIVYYRGEPPSPSGSLSGLFNRQSPTWGNQVTWTLSQPFGALTWWPTKQILHDKADSLWTFLTVPLGTRAGAVGRLEGVDTLPNGKVRFRWKSKYPITYYLVSFAVAEYIDYSFYVSLPNIPQPVLVQNYIYDNPQTLPYFIDQIDTTAALMREFSLVYGPYPFWEEKYGHMMAPFSGGMEHQTMTTQGFFSFTLTAHELAHQWFGDWVTCGSWQDIWLNEGFATYSEYIALEALGTPTERREWLIQVHDDVVSEPNGTVWVPDTLQEGRIFSGRLSYHKGAYLLHMIRFHLGNDSLFFSILRDYLSTYGGGNAWLQDFRSYLEARTGESWAGFFQQWYYGEGFPIFSCVWNESGGTLWLVLRQRGSWQASVPFFKTPLEIQIQRQSRPDTLLRLTITQPVHTFSIEGVGSVRQILIDPSYWILRQIDTLRRDLSLGMPSGRAPLLISPHPIASGGVACLSLPSPGQIEIRDSCGRCVERLNPQNRIFYWQVGLSPGLYVLRWQGLNGGEGAIPLLVIP